MAAGVIAAWKFGRQDLKRFTPPTDTELVPDPTGALGCNSMKRVPTRQALIDQAVRNAVPRESLQPNPLYGVTPAVFGVIMAFENAIRAEFRRLEAENG